MCLGNPYKDKYPEDFWATDPCLSSETALLYPGSTINRHFFGDSPVQAIETHLYRCNLEQSGSFVCVASETRTDVEGHMKGHMKGLPPTISFCSRNIGEVAPKIMYFYYPKMYLQDQSVDKKTFNLTVKKAALTAVSENGQFWCCIISLLQHHLASQISEYKNVTARDSSGNRDVMYVQIS